jgi:rhamnose transport system substrate-binding protein
MDFSLHRRACCLGALAYAVGGGAWGASATRAGLNIAFLPKQINNPYHLIVGAGVTEAMRELNGTGKMVGPNSAQALSQKSFIDQLIVEKPDAIILAANDPIALLPSVRQAIAAGSKIVAVDSDLATDARDLFINQASQEGVGRAQMALMAQLMGGKGEFAVLSATPTSGNQNSWIYWMKQELRRTPYRDMTLVKVAYGNDDPADSLAQVKDLLLSYPNLRGIISPTTVGIFAAARHLSTLLPKRQVQLTGLGTPNEMREFIKNGAVTAFQLWNPKDLGYLAAYAAAHLASGTITGKRGETFVAGRLGNYTISAKGEVILGSPTTFDKQNIDQFNY